MLQKNVRIKYHLFIEKGPIFRVEIMVALHNHRGFIVDEIGSLQWLCTPSFAKHIAMNFRSLEFRRACLREIQLTH